MDRITRKELKTDKFAEEVEHSLEYVSEHKRQLGIYSGAALAVVLIVGGVLYYRSQQHATRQQDLGDAIQLYEAEIGPTSPYATAEAKRTEAVKRFNAVLSKHSGSNEAAIAASYLGSIEADQGKLTEAERYFRLVVSQGDKDYASLGKVSLAQVCFATGRAAEGEKLLRSAIDNPTVLVSKEAATLALARALASSKPAEARKLLDPLKGARPAVSQTALMLLAELPQ